MVTTPLRKAAVSDSAKMIDMFPISVRMPLKRAAPGMSSTRVRAAALVCGFRSSKFPICDAAE